MELLWYGVIAVYILGAVAYFGLDPHLPRCPDCRLAALIISRQIAGSSPPVFELVYRCPGCLEILWKRFVSTVSE
jgi:uncharacterized protein with PIN domain